MCVEVGAGNSAKADGIGEVDRCFGFIILGLRVVNLRHNQRAPGIGNKSTLVGISQSTIKTLLPARGQLKRFKFDASAAWKARSGEHCCEAEFDPYLLDNAKWYKIRNRNYSQWVAREKLFERERPTDPNWH